LDTCGGSGDGDTMLAAAKGDKGIDMNKCLTIGSQKGA
jgi:hypothetical protein